MYSKLQLNYNYVGDYAIVLIQRQYNYTYLLHFVNNPSYYT